MNHDQHRKQEANTCMEQCEESSLLRREHLHDEDYHDRMKRNKGEYHFLYWE